MMAYDPRQHHRRSIRLEGYDYASAGAYFVTVCTQDGASLLGVVVDGETRLNDAGRMVQAVWDQLPDSYPGVAVDAFQVMPNHVHGIIVLTGDPVGATPSGCPDPTLGQARGPAPTGAARQTRGVAPTMSLEDVVHRFKSLTTNKYARCVRTLGWPAFSRRLWQRNYYEHIIRNEESLNHIRQYIADNPARWAYDRENPAAINPEPEDAWRI